MNILKLISSLFLLLMLDVTKPFGLSLNVEFLFLGVIFCSLNCNVTQAIVLSALFGYSKDSMLTNGYGLSVFEFSLVCIVTTIVLRYILFASRRRHSHLANSVVVLIALVIHLVFSSLYYHAYSFIFCLKFLFHSLVLWFLISFLLGRWLNSRSISPINTYV